MTIKLQNNKFSPEDYAPANVDSTERTNIYIYMFVVLKQNSLSSEYEATVKSYACSRRTQSPSRIHVCSFSLTDSSQRDNYLHPWNAPGQSLAAPVGATSQ